MNSELVETLSLCAKVLVGAFIAILMMQRKEAQ